MSAITSKIYTRRYAQLMKEFPLRRIRNKAEAEAATEILDRLFRDAYEDEGEADYVYVLSNLLDDYEEKQEEAIPEAKGLDVLREFVAQHDMTQGDVAEILGVSQSAVSLILSGERKITLDHARALAKKFDVPFSMFL